MTDTATQQIVKQEATQRVVRVVEDESSFANLLDTSKFEHMWRVAQMFATSTIVPDHYRNSPGNCFIACEMAVRMGMSPFPFMQRTYVVHGKIGIESQLAISLINTSGLFEDSLDYEIQGEDPDDPMEPSYRARAFAVRKSTGKRVNGPWVTWQMVKAEGWDAHDGSKWLTLPELMFQYRAAMFFGRLHCPERLLGMNTSDELDDIGQRVTAAAAAGQPVSALDAAKRAREIEQQEAARASASKPAQATAANAPPNLAAAPLATAGAASTDAPGHSSVGLHGTPDPSEEAASKSPVGASVPVQEAAVAGAQTGTPAAAPGGEGVVEESERKAALRKAEAYVKSARTPDEIANFCMTNVGKLPGDEAEMAFTVAKLADGKTFLEQDPDALTKYATLVATWLVLHGQRLIPFAARRPQAGAAK